MTQYICTVCGLVVRAGLESPPQHCHEFMAETEMPQALLDLDRDTRHHQLVYHVIHEEAPVVGIDVVHETEISPGTVYPVIQDLADEGLIESRPMIGRNNNAEQWATDPDAFDDPDLDRPSESLTP